MEEILVKGYTLPQAYHMALAELEKKGENGDCADWNCSQKEVSMTMVVENPLAEPMISRLFIGGPIELQQYVMEMLDGILDFEIEKGNWKYTYHDRIKDQISFIVEELKRSPSSRRAVITVRTPEDMGSEDPACMQHLQFFVRNGKLDCKVLFRSNDACKASFMNAFAIIMLQKRIADALELPMGTYCHRANSYHCYEKDYDMLKGYVKRIEEDEEDDITFEYEGDWAEIMADAIPDILKQAELLKNNTDSVKREYEVFFVVEGCVEKEDDPIGNIECNGFYQDRKQDFCLKDGRYSTTVEASSWEEALEKGKEVFANENFFSLMITDCFLEHIYCPETDVWWYDK